MILNGNDSRPCYMNFCNVRNLQEAAGDSQCGCQPLATPCKQKQHIASLFSMCLMDGPAYGLQWGAAATNQDAHQRNTANIYVQNI